MSGLDVDFTFRPPPGGYLTVGMLMRMERMGARASQIARMVDLRGGFVFIDGGSKPFVHDGVGPAFRKMFEAVHVGGVPHVEPGSFTDRYQGLYDALQPLDPISGGYANGHLNLSVGLHLGDDAESGAGDEFAPDEAPGSARW